MIKVIVNADDFGCNDSITKSIQKLLLGGFISSTTIMANGRDLDNAVRFAKEHQEFSFGAHLCLSEYASITNDTTLRKYGLIDHQGIFITHSIFKKKSFPLELLCSIKKELSAQVEALLSKGISVSHIDSHHHVHTIYPLKEVFVDVAKEYGIKKVRRATEFDTIRAKLHLIQYIQRRNLNSYYTKHLMTTNLFMPYLQIYNKAHSISDNVESIELMCHPGHLNDEYYIRETDRIITNPIHRELGWQLISYNEL